MAAHREIRADFDRDTIVVYQAYRPEVADAALEAGRFVPPFSFGRMTWIKPSFLWLMERSNWARKPSQEQILSVRIQRQYWEKALSNAVLTSFEAPVHRSIAEWQKAFQSAIAHVQWDAERSIHGAKLGHRAIQVGISRVLIAEYAHEWIVEITDLTPLTKKIRRLCEEGHYDRAKRLLPRERRYDVSPAIAQSLGMGHG